MVRKLLKSHPTGFFRNSAGGSRSGLAEVEVS